MNFKNVSELLVELIDIESVTGKEAQLGEFLANFLKQAGFAVDRMVVQNNRVNIFAKIGQPKIVLQAHMDVVPPHIPARQDADYIYGRGACDTKGSIASMLTAAIIAKEKGVTNFGLLFTVGEEVDFAGAKSVQSFVEDLGTFLIVGEPTQLKPVTAHYGIQVVSLICSGKAAHSSEPALGENAIDKLVALLSGPVKQLDVSPNTLMSLVKISGGVADNIIPDTAEALLSFRVSPGDHRNYAEQIQDFVGKDGAVKELQNLPPVASSVPKSLNFLGRGESVKYCTELTFLKNGLVLGPGSIADAHTSNESVKKADLKLATDLYVRVLESYS